MIKTHKIYTVLIYLNKTITDRSIYFVEGRKVFLGEVFQFDLNESLFFENGQEVKEMQKISLDPEITVQPFHEYVSIRGVVELQGEYEKEQMNDKVELKDIDTRDHYSKRYLERIEDIDEKRASFSHRFPVEISVPAYRVTDINDITVNIDTFDYEIPSNNQLNLVATIAIEGVSDESLNENEEHREGPNELEEDHFALDLNIAKHKAEQEQKTDKEQNEDEEITQIEMVADDEEVKEEQAEEVDNRWFKQKVESLESFFNKQKDKQKTEHDLTENKEEDKVANQTIENEEESVDEENEEEVPTTETRIDEIKTSDSESEDVTYLTDIFRDREDEQTHVKLKICIVQDKDTITGIAERYEVSESLIRKQNELTDDELTAGQLISIPSK